MHYLLNGALYNQWLCKIPNCSSLVECFDVTARLVSDEREERLTEETNIEVRERERQRYEKRTRARALIL